MQMADERGEGWGGLGATPSISLVPSLEPRCLQGRLSPRSTPRGHQVYANLPICLVKYMSLIGATLFEDFYAFFSFRVVLVFLSFRPVSCSVRANWVVGTWRALSSRSTPGNPLTADVRREKCKLGGSAGNDTRGRVLRR